MTRDRVTLPDVIVDHFVAQIVTGALAPGERLPPYRKLATELGVDETSLRFGLTILGRMNLIRSVQGSGTTVNDYRRHARLDLLDAMFRIEQLELGKSFQSHGLDLYIRMVPMIAREALAIMRPEAMLEIGRLYGLILQEASTSGEVARIVNLDGEVISALAASLSDPYVQLAVNTSKRLRQSLTKRVLMAVPPLEHYTEVLSFFSSYQNKKLDLDRLEAALRAHLVQVTTPLYDYFATLPEEPYLTAPILPPPDSGGP